MKLSKEMAVRLHRMMWSDMQKELGNNPSGEMRIKFKEDWIKRNFPEALVMHNCFLCEYSFHQEGRCCPNCPIKWPDEHCNGYNFSYEKAPISDILALPGKDLEPTGFADITYDSYYKFREEQISKASGLPASVSIKDHIKAIREKAVEEYFEKTPGAKLATMDVDEAFKQYADEQKAPIFHALAEASGLSADNKSIKAHISEISTKAKYSGRKEAFEEIFKSLSIHSGVSPDICYVGAHVDAIREKASNKKDMETLRKTSMQLADKLDKYKDALSKESDLDRNRPVDYHIKKIVDDSFNEGRDHERERIMDKIGEMLNDKSTGKKADS